MVVRVPPGDLLVGITSLVMKSMLVADVTGDVARYRLLETTRVYALEKLNASGEAEQVYRRHARHVQALLHRDEAAITLSAWLARCRRAMDDLHAALDRSLAPCGDSATGIALVVAAIPVWFRLSMLTEHRAYITQALDALKQDSQPDPQSEMVLQAALGLNLYFTDGPVETVVLRMRHALELARQTGAHTYESRIIWMLSFVSGNAGDYRSELAYAQAYGKAMRDPGDILAPFRFDRLHGRALHELGRHAEAQPLVEHALTASRTPPIFARLTAYDNDHWVAARAVRVRLLWLRGQPDDAMVELQACLTDGLRIEHARSICWALTFSLCPVAIWCGRLDVAQHLLAVLLMQSRKTFQHWHVWGALYADIVAQLEADPSAVSLAHEPSYPAQADLIGTLADGLATATAQARAEADPETWCAAEILRARAQQMLDGRAAGSPAQAEALLLTAARIAADQGRSAGNCA